MVDGAQITKCIIRESGLIESMIAASVIIITLAISIAKNAGPSPESCSLRENPHDAHFSVTVSSPQ